MSDKPTETPNKFPVNLGSLAGLVVRESFNDKSHRANLTLIVTDASKPKYLNVLISGKERYENFKKNFEAALKNLGQEEGKQIKPMLFVKGQAYFSSNKTENGTNQNFTLIAVGNFEKNDDLSQLTSSKEELQEFRKTFHQKNPEINQINIRGNVSSAEITPLNGKNGTYYKFSMAHNYIKADKQQAVMYANIIVPTSNAKQLEQAAVEKGTPILMSAKVNPRSYQNKEGKTLYSFTLNTTAIHRDHTKSTSIKKASEAIDKVANNTKKTDRLKQAENEKNDLKR